MSTFALDIDTGSWTRFRDAVSQGHRVPSTEARTEELVNHLVAEMFAQLVRIVERIVA